MWYLWAPFKLLSLRESSRSSVEFGQTSRTFEKIGIEDLEHSMVADVVTMWHDLEVEHGSLPIR